MAPLRGMVSYALGQLRCVSTSSASTAASAAASAASSSSSSSSSSATSSKMPDRLTEHIKVGEFSTALRALLDRQHRRRNAKIGRLSPSFLSPLVFYHGLFVTTRGGGGDRTVSCLCSLSCFHDEVGRGLIIFVLISCVYRHRGERRSGLHGSSKTMPGSDQQTTWTESVLPRAYSQPPRTTRGGEGSGRGVRATKGIR